MPLFNLVERRALCPQDMRVDVSREDTSAGKWNAQAALAKTQRRAEAFRVLGLSLQESRGRGAAAQRPEKAPLPSGTECRERALTPSLSRFHEISPAAPILCIAG